VGQGGLRAGLEPQGGRTGAIDAQKKEGRHHNATEEESSADRDSRDREDGRRKRGEEGGTEIALF